MTLAATAYMGVCGQNSYAFKFASREEWVLHNFLRKHNFQPSKLSQGCI